MKINFTYSTLNFKFLISIIISLFCFSNSFAQSRKIVILGSSTAAGLAASTPDSAWVNRLNNLYKKQLVYIDTIYNLGVSGTTMYNSMPSSYTAPSGKPSRDTAKNVTKAKSLLSGLGKNGVVIVNFPTNGYDNYSVTEILTALTVIYDSVVAANHICYITTTQPRNDGNFGTYQTRTKLSVLKDSIINRFGTYALNFWDSMYNASDTTIRTIYSAGDNVHFNNAGHRILYDRVVAKNIFDPIGTGDYRTNVNPSGQWSTAATWQRFNGIGWATATVAPDSTSGKISILNGDSILTSSNLSLDQVTVDSGGVLTFFNTGGATTYNLANGSGNDLTVNGKVYVSVNGTLIGKGNMVITNKGTLVLRNYGILAVTTENNGIMNISGTGIISGVTFTNYGISNLTDYTLLLNSNCIFNNNGLFNFNYNGKSYIASSPGNNGIFNNTTLGTVFKTDTNDIARINSTVSFNNSGTIKGAGDLVFIAGTNTGIIEPGNNNAGKLQVNPSFISTRTPTVNLEINSTGAVAGTNYDQIRFSTVDSFNTKINGITLNLFDYGNDTIGTTYTLLTSPSGSISGTLQSVNIPSNFGNLTYTSNSVTVQKTALSKVWDGGAGTQSWKNAINWNPDGVPVATDHVTIASGTTILVDTAAVTNDLVLNNASLNLSLQSGASLTVNGKLYLAKGNININGQQLTLAGTNSSLNTGTIIGSSLSNLTINGSGAFGSLKMNQSNPGSSNLLNNFTFNRTSSGTISLGNSLNVIGIITPTNGTLTTNDKLVLTASSATAYGQVAGTGSGTISGNVTVQKYLQNIKTGWRHLSLPAQTTINSISGMQVQTTSNPIISQRSGFYWDAAPVSGTRAKGWIQATNSSDNTNAYSIYNDTSHIGLHELSNNISVTGSLVQSAYSINLYNTRDSSGPSGTSNEYGWNFIPNRFASNIDISDLIGDVDFQTGYKAVHVWDIVAQQYVGINSSGLINYNTSSSISTNTNLSPWQAFWVKADSSSQSIQIKNTHRTTSMTDVRTFMKNSPDYMRLNVKDKKGNKDQIAVQFAIDASEDFEGEKELFKLKSISAEVPTLYIQQGKYDQSAIVVPYSQNRSLNLVFETYKNNEEYTFSPDFEHFLYNDEVVLEDIKTGVFTNLRNSNYKFFSDTSFQKQRFKLHFNTQHSSISQSKDFNNTYVYADENGIEVLYKNQNSGEVYIYNVLGQEVYHKTQLMSGENIVFRPFSNTHQIYFVHVITDGISNTYKIIY